MNIPFAEFKTQFKCIEGEVRAAIDEVLESAWYVLGRQLEAFEEEFAGYIGVGHAVGVGSGTEALHLALTAVGVERDDEVVTVANTCVPTVAAISAAGARPVLVDCDAQTLTMDPARLEAAITGRTKAIVPVHLYGHPCDMDPILAIALRHGIPVVEDCAQAHGTRYRDRVCGGLGTAATFSFYPSKNLGAYGDAGAVTTNDAEIGRKLRMLRNYGQEKRYHHSIQGFNSRLDEMQAAILRVKLKHLDEWNEARRQHAAAYSAQLGELPLRLPREASWARHIYHLYVIRTPRRDELQEYLQNMDIGTLLHYPIPIHLQEAYKGLGHGVGDFPEAEKACNEVLSLPLYPELRAEAREAVCRGISSFSD